MKQEFEVRYIDVETFHGMDRYVGFYIGNTLILDINIDHSIELMKLYNKIKASEPDNR